MKLLSFLKRRGTSASVTPASSGAQTPQANANASQIIRALLRTEQPLRDLRWQNKFYENVATAAFECGEPHILTTVPGRSFFVLNTPKPGQAFEAVCISDLKDFLMEKGLGVAINPASPNEGWMFSYGDILCLWANNFSGTNRPVADTSHIEMTKRVEVIKKGEHVLLAQPSASYFPLQARTALKSVLQQKGMPHLSLLLMCRKKDGRMLEELVFRCSPGHFEKDELMATIGWFLPSHYPIALINDDNWMKRYFEPL